MTQRIKDCFWPSKRMAALGVIVYLALAIWFFYQGSVMVGMGLGLLIYAFWYAFVLAYKLRRDYRPSQPVPAQTPPPVIPRRNPESNLFIVPPEYPSER